jgi:K+-sensing histidine kinase KdpD
MFIHISRPLQNVAVLVVCAVSAILATMLFASRPARFLIPIAFVAVLVLVAMRYGALVGILGSLLAGAIFAYFLYPPAHSLKVQDAGDRSQLAWVVLAGVALSYLLAGPGPHADSKK